MKNTQKTYDVIIVGGGAAGLMSAISAAEKGCTCLLLEQKDRTGQKILITGKGRCNITNNCEISGIFENVRRNPRFLYSAIYSFTNKNIVNYFNLLGVPTKVERGGRIFPVSDKASDVADALTRDAVSKGVLIKTRIKVKGIYIQNGVAKGVECSDTVYMANKVILACGGASYPTTGSDGSGFALAKDAGHRIIPPKGSLTGLNTKQTWPKEAMGITLKNVGLSLFKKEKKIFYMQGEMLLTHFGISGPIVLTGSACLAGSDYKYTVAMIDLKPALEKEKLDKRILRDFQENSRRQFSNSLGGLLPLGLIEPIIKLSGINPEKKVNQITQAERKKLVVLLKGVRLDITGARPLKEAIVTAGGVDTGEINPSTMESKVIRNLYFCGEMMDVDANTGGYNLTIAFSTGRLAGISCAEDCR